MTAQPDTRVTDDTASEDAAAAVVARWLAAWQQRAFRAMATLTQPSWFWQRGREAGELQSRSARDWLLQVRNLVVTPCAARQCCVRCQILHRHALAAAAWRDGELELVDEAGRWGVRPL
jgi:hypothetical protein